MSLLKAELFLQMITEGKIREIINVTQGRFPITGMAQATWQGPESSLSEGSHSLKTTRTSVLQL